MNKKLFFGAVILCFLTGIVEAGDNRCISINHAKINVIAGSTYHKARKVLLATGWQPVQTVSWQEKNEKLFG